MKNSKIILLMVILLSLVLFTSCRSDGPSGVDITGVWDGLVSDAYSPDSLYFDFNSDGSAKMAGESVYSTGKNADLTWSLDENYLEITDMFYLYSTKFVYLLSLDGETMTLYMIAGNIMNSSYDDLSPGDVITLTKAADGTSITDLVNTESSY